jgi:hypothetical protein
MSSLTHTAYLEELVGKISRIGEDPKKSILILKILNIHQIQAQYLDLCVIYY